MRASSFFSRHLRGILAVEATVEKEGKKNERKARKKGRKEMKMKGR